MAPTKTKKNYSASETKGEMEDSCSSVQLTKLFSQVDRVGEDITRMRKAFEENTISFNPLQIQCRLEILNSYIAKPMALQSEIDIIDRRNRNRSALEENCVITEAKYMLAAGTGEDHKQLALVTGSSHSNLPKMKLPKFSGKHSEYKQFIGIFEQLVDSDNSLSYIEKFNHLLACPSVEALGTIKALQVSDANYKKALASLKRVYDNKCLIFFETLAQLFEIPSITKPSASALRLKMPGNNISHQVRQSSVHTAQQALLSLDRNTIGLCFGHIPSPSHIRVPMDSRGPRNTIPYCQGCPSKVMSLYLTYSTPRVSTPPLLEF